MVGVRVRFLLLVGLLTALGASSAFAQLASNDRSQSSQSSMPAVTPMSAVKIEPVPVNTEPGEFHMVAGLSESTNLYSGDALDRVAGSELLINPSLSFNAYSKISFKTFISHQDTSPGDTTVSNTTISLSTTGPAWRQRLKSWFFVSGIAPTNQDNRYTDRFQGAVALGTKIVLSTGMFETTYVLKGQRNFHEYTVSGTGDPNIEYNIVNDLTVDTIFNDFWSISTEGMYGQGFTYHDYQHATFGFEMDLNYSFNKQWQASIGFANEGDALQPNGTESNIRVYDQNSSTVKVGITFAN